jgi:hypothetical protein
MSDKIRISALGSKEVGLDGWIKHSFSEPRTFASKLRFVLVALELSLAMFATHLIRQLVIAIFS